MAPIDYSLLTINCSSCSGSIQIPLNSAATFSCQDCGCQSGTVLIDEVKHKRRGIIEFYCAKCDDYFGIPRGVKSVLACPYCGGMVLTGIKEVIYSKVIKEDMKQSKIIGEHLPNIDYLGRIIDPDFCVDATVKVVIPYYDGNKLIDRAIKTWILPEVVFALTDEGTIPPGYGVCHQFFTSKNAKGEGLHPNKTKPFLMDLLKKLTKLFPNEEYYGFFNSDVILPPGIPLRYLMPSTDKDIVFHHRLDLFGSKNHSAPVAKLVKGNVVACGKDGFIAKKEIIDIILKKVPELVIGAPCWDDGLLLWCWKEFGMDKVELRFGEIWHVFHRLDWSVEERDAAFNQTQLDSVGIPFALRASIRWGDVEEKYPTRKLKMKTLGIIQPGRVGDVVIVLPIARWFYERGYKVIWPVCTEFMPLFDYVTYVEAIDIGGDISGSYQRAIGTLRGNGANHTLDLGIGFGRHEEDWINSKLHFNEWKYREAGVPAKERFNLQINRNFAKEQFLWDHIKNTNNLNGVPYNVIHDVGTKGPYQFNVDGIRIHPLGDFTIFDWIGVIEMAKHLYCVDSCIANLADQMKLCVDRRSVWFWKDIPDPDPKRRALGFPKLSKDWNIL